MNLPFQIRRFVRDEDGTLLVFFMVCTITILGIVALSFDMGRRAATQTDMQSFADNVALAIAGELDGSPNAVANATRAATLVIDATNEQLKGGTAGQNFTLSLANLVFYEELPDRDGPTSFDVSQLRDPTSANYKYALPPSDLASPPDPALVNYVGVRLNTVDVDWLFANVFSSADLPDRAVSAVAVAGNAALHCDLAPIAFCLPNDGSGVPPTLVRGTAIQLRTAQQNAIWQPADFGFVNVGLDTAGSCIGLTNEAGRQACLMTLQQNRVAACFQPDQADLETGQRPFQEVSAFNMSFDMFEQSMIQFASNNDYAPGPHSVKGAVPSGSSAICTPAEPSDTMAFPLDDCFVDSGGPGCVDGRFGDGDWSAGRTLYNERNYTIWDLPFDPSQPNNSYRTALVDGSFFDFPESSLTRYQFYRREIQRAAGGGVMSRSGTSPYNLPRHLVDNDGGRGTATPEDPTAYTTWDDYWPDSFSGLNPIIPDAHQREDNGLPQCNTSSPSGGQDRRVMLMAAISCPSGGDAVQGDEEGVRIEGFYSVFQLAPVTVSSGTPPQFDLSVEVIRPVAASSLTPYREVVQLYR